MAILFDVLALGVIAVTAFLAARKGFVRALIEFVGFFLALVIAVIIGGFIADAVYTHSVRPMVTESITTAIKDGNAEAIDKMPKLFQSLLIQSDIDVNKLEDHVGQTATSTAGKISDAVIKPITLSIVKSVSSVVIFILLIIAVKLLARIVNALFSGKVLGKANFALGAVIGIAKGFVFSSVIFLAINAIASVCLSDNLDNVKTVLNNSLFYKCVSLVFSLSF